MIYPTQLDNMNLSPAAIRVYIESNQAPATTDYELAAICFDQDATQPGVRHHHLTKARNELKARGLHDDKQPLMVPIANPPLATHPRETIYFYYPADTNRRQLDTPTWRLYLHLLIAAQTTNDLPDLYADIDERCRQLRITTTEYANALQALQEQGLMPIPASQEDDDNA